MKLLVITSKVMGYIWLVLASILILVGIAEVWVEDGFSGVQDLLSPFNIAHWVVTLAILAPSLGLLMLSEKLQSGRPTQREEK
ncbi:hypothetical protein ACFL17_08610 [Pseudomonadota bacterium]